ncbi:FAD binding domain-containing protein [Subtercola boreus]|uniref:FAD-binding molybdopterin dehydrogenase n=1 Tax=Subtercola boreus TaxID=120213 RepID=A0A3E0WF02_9MICO|nr:FAD binding domain-containing protein [Subtercola boreus]RFA22002.1 FAD-binding molybdopterin dehydrogenase [Subtercola boreus]RFA22182.1 FAD-binding molybdopterin dehydrogenase [Subtercola boreus]RFA28044.1 FAD-binding molybdopterin dehydrogenase [Subtercola boreus]
MDLNTVTEVHLARDRADLRALGESVAAVAGGSALYGEPQHHLTALVDLTTMGWPALTRTDDGLEIAATCTLAELSQIPAQPGWAAHHAFFDCCTALYGSFKVWNVATVGGNLCAALPAGPMTSLTAALDGEALVWRADGSDERMPVAAFITGNKTTALNPGDVLRSITLPEDSLLSRVAYRKIALSPLGRSGAVLLGRLAPGGAFVLTVTGGTVRPIQLRYETRPPAATLRSDVLAISEWFTDAHGAADWRRAVSALLAEEIREELS